MLNYYKLNPKTEANKVIDKIRQCIMTNDLDQLTNLVNENPNLLCMADILGRNAFHKLANNHCNEFVEGFFELYDQVKIQLNSNPMNAIPNEFGEFMGYPITPLYIALCQDNLLVIQEFLQRGAQLDPTIVQRLLSEKNLPHTIDFFNNRENLDYPEYDLITLNIPEQVYPESDDRRQNLSL